MRKGSVQDLLKECMVFLHLCPRRRWFYYQKAWHSNNAKENLETVIVQVQPSRTLQFSNKILPHLVIFVTYCLSLVVLHSFHTNQRVYYTCYSFNLTGQNFLPNTYRPRKSKITCAARPRSPLINLFLQ